MSETLRRAARDEVPRNKRWQISGVWEVELDRVTAWLRDLANFNYGKLGSLEAALEAGRGLPEEVVARFGGESIAINPKVLEEADLGTLEKQAPSVKALAAFNILKWIAFSCETLLFVFMVLMGMANAVVIVVGLLLALSGLAAGYGTGTLLVAHESGRGLRSLRGWISLVLGLVSAATLSWLRAMGVEEGAFAAIAIPIILALVIALFEALDLTQSAKYKQLYEEMFRAQVWYATDQHRRRFSDGLWWKVYEGELQRSAKRVSEVYHGGDTQKVREN